MKRRSHLMENVTIPGWFLKAEVVPEINGVEWRLAPIYAASRWTTTKFRSKASFCLN